MPMNPRLMRPLARRQAPAPAPTDPLFADVEVLLHFDGAFTDSSLNAGTVTAYGDAQIDATNKKFGSGSGLFDDNGDYLSVSTPTAFASNDDFTVECWVRVGEVTDYQPFAMQSGGWVFYAYQSTIYWGKPLVSNDLDGEWSPVVGEWYHVAACRASGTLRLFVDGVQVASGANTSAYNGNTNPTLVANYDGVGFFSSNIDDFRITRAARYTANFTPPTAAFPNSAPPPPPASTSLLLNFNSDTSDSSGNSVSVTNNGVSISTSTKKYGSGSGYFDGSDYLTVPSSASVSGTGDFTVEFWVWIETAQDAQILVPGSGGLTVSLGYGGLRVWAGSPAFATESGDELSTETWHHIAVTRASGTGTIYLDGVAKQSASLGNNFTATAFDIGLNGGEALIGYLDDLRITKGLARYTANFTPPTGPLSASVP